MAKARAKAKAPSKSTVEELYFRSDSAYLCVILNRRTQFARVIDFRAGALPAKRLYIQSVGKKEGIAKVITLVEKDEVSSWIKVGFTREGTIPGFYKRSDGHLCGRVITENSDAKTSADTRLAERTINHAKKNLETYPAKVRGASIKEVDERTALKARDAVWRTAEGGLHAFDTFGRDAARMYYATKYKKTKANYISAEFQDCFGHALIELLRRPETENDFKAVLQGLRDLGDILKERGIVSGFMFAPSDDREFAIMMLSAGYRKTGLLAGAIVREGQRKDAILWSRKFANPAES